MFEIGLAHYLTVAAILFTLGIFGIFLNRKNVIVILMSIELMLLAVNINLIAFSTHLHDLVGQVFALFVLTVAAAEAAIGLVRAHRGGGGGGDRPRDPGGLLPQPRLDRGRGHQPDEGLSRPCWKPPSSFCR
jgi:NADH-quinone oxidoreductase subunit K